MNKMCIRDRIFRSVYELAGCQKPMKRLWISSMEDSAIREGFENLRPDVYKRQPLVERLHGQVIKISPTSTNYINPMDLNLDYSDDESPLSLKSDFILSLCELIVGCLLYTSRCV